ncbi:8095_t:CDS:1 [Acaulospora morrowiae]|uniref:8095_t:CDS:1 n=1 Tax=Acaulospora morrowiae TaxID=94023 RepID=A0A9N8VNI5_9GLOM|nr:8095_t:CDS:1 [Acaulospora morrowiae]
MSFLADFEPALIHFPYDQNQRLGFARETFYSKLFGRKKINRVNSRVEYNPVNLENRTNMNTVVNNPTPATTAPTNSKSSTSRMKRNMTSTTFSPSESQFFDRDQNYWTDKLVTFFLMMPY